MPPTINSSNHLTVATLIEKLIKKFGNDSKVIVVDSFGNPIDRLKLVPLPDSLVGMEETGNWKQNSDGNWIYQPEVVGMLQFTSNATIKQIKDELLEQDLED